MTLGSNKLFHINDKNALYKAYIIYKLKCETFSILKKNHL